MNHEHKQLTAPVSGKQAALERSALFVATPTSFMGPFMISSVNTEVRLHAKSHQDEPVVVSKDA